MIEASFYATCRASILLEFRKGISLQATARLSFHIGLQIRPERTAAKSILKGEIMVRKMVTLGLLTLLQGCSSNDVAPTLASNSNVKTVLGGQGYPVLYSIRFISPKASTTDQAALCAKAGVEGLEADPVVIDRNVQVSGSSSFEPPPPSIGKPFRYTLLISTGISTVFTFDRIRYTNAGPIGAISGVGAEQAYEVMREIADRAEQCLPVKAPSLK